METSVDLTFYYHETLRMYARHEPLTAEARECIQDVHAGRLHSDFCACLICHLIADSRHFVADGSDDDTNWLVQVARMCDARKLTVPDALLSRWALNYADCGAWLRVARVVQVDATSSRMSLDLFAGLYVRAVTSESGDIARLVRARAANRVLMLTRSTSLQRRVLGVVDLLNLVVSFLIGDEDCVGNACVCSAACRCRLDKSCANTASS